MKALVHPKIHPYVVPSLYDLHFSCGTQKRMTKCLSCFFSYWWPHFCSE